MSTQTIVDDLKAARAVLERGWCKGALEDGKGSHCVLGAIALVTTGDSYALNSRAGAAMELIADQVSGSMGDLVDFNNADETTLEDVLGLFDKALSGLLVAA